MVKQQPLKLSSAEEEAISKLLKRVQELIALDKFDDAKRFLDEILKYKPDCEDAFFQYGNVFMAEDNFEAAVPKYEQALEINPTSFENLNNLGSAYVRLKKYDDAIIYYKIAAEMEPFGYLVLSPLAMCLTFRGHLDEAIIYYKRAIARAPQKSFDFYCDMLFTMIYAESVSPETLAQEAANFGKNMADPVLSKIPHTNEKDKERKLRVGYVSGDYKEHPVPYFLEPVMRRHNREKFEIFAYSNTKDDNPVMERMKTVTDVWRDIRKMSDEDAEALIRSDEIDILVDVSGHTNGNRLMVFASKPAPVQVTWLGYPATTGMKAINYRITDAYAEPEGMTEHLNTEKLWRLPRIFCCYQGHENSPAVIDHPPFEDNGYITFGCFNNFLKVRDPVLATWAKIIQSVPNSRLLLEIAGLDDATFYNLVMKRLDRQKFPMDRVILKNRERANQFVLYNSIDIALDPFPCSGGTTTMDALWMGVPVITMAGKHFVSRMGVTILSNAGLPELIADSVEDYISIAKDLALDKDHLKKVRYNLRDKFLKSPAMDQISFTHDMEEAYREMWNIYCG